MPGRDPKPAGQRRRRNKPPETVKLPAAGAERTVPRLPGATKMLASTRRYWQTIWASPMAVVWLDADVPALERLALLVDLVSRGDASAGVLSEIRQLEDRFGLSPLSRKRLQWELAAATAARGDRGEPPAESPAAGGDDDERWLRAV